MTILTDKLSGSASEVMTGALKDYNRALVVGGIETHGKFSTQTIHPLTTKDPTQTHEKKVCNKIY